MFESNFTGALLDERTTDKKVDDIHLHEIVGSVNIVNWINKSPRSFPALNQNQSLMCGANALAKALGIAFSITYGTYLPFSRADIYQRRANRPGAGMLLYDMFDIASKGVTLEQLTVRDIFTDSDADTLNIESFKHKVGEIFSTMGGIVVPLNIETIASIIQTTGKGVVLLIWFLASEYSRQIPIIQDYTLDVREDRALRHFVTAVDFTLINGVKYLCIEDSAWFGGMNTRLLSENWVKTRIADAMYPMNFKFIPGSIPKPHYDGVTIISAQRCLQYEGLFPINVSFVENIGAITRKAILDFQLKYGIQQTGNLGPITKAKLAELYP
jgi:hypothetical protein